MQNAGYYSVVGEGQRSGFSVNGFRPSRALKP